MMRVWVLAIVFVACMGSSKEPPPPASPNNAPPPTAAPMPATSNTVPAGSAAITGDREQSYYCFHAPSTGDPNEVLVYCWRGFNTCDTYARQQASDKSPTCEAVASVHCYDSVYPTRTVSSCTPAKADCVTLRTTEQEHNRQSPKLTECVERH